MTTAAEFKTRYPEFAPVSDALIVLVMADASAEVSDAWITADHGRAINLLTAHLLTIEGEPGRTLTGLGSAGSGLVKRDKVGDAETEFATAAATDLGGYGSTAYGRQYLALMARSFPAIAVV